MRSTMMTTRCSVRSVRCEVNPLLRSWPSSGRVGPSMYSAGSGHLRDPRDGVLRLWHRSAKVRRPRQALMLRAVPAQQMRRATASGLRASLSRARFRSRHLPLLGTCMITFGELIDRASDQPLQQLVGRDIVRLLAGFEPSLTLPERLSEIAIGPRSPAALRLIASYRAATSAFGPWVYYAETGGQSHQSTTCSAINCRRMS
jgi:hypothetical protein